MSIRLFIYTKLYVVITPDERLEDKHVTEQTAEVGKNWGRCREEVKIRRWA